MSKNMPLEFDAKVLTDCSWPVKKVEKALMGLPPQVQSCIDTFTSFYMSQFQNNRKLSWSLDHGSAEVHFKTDKKYRIIVSTR
jgi:hypothetical protein